MFMTDDDCHISSIIFKLQQTWS